MQRICKTLPKVAMEMEFLHPSVQGNHFPVAPVQRLCKTLPTMQLESESPIARLFLTIEVDSNLKSVPGGRQLTALVDQASLLDVSMGGSGLRHLSELNTTNNGMTTLVLEPVAPSDCLRDQARLKQVASAMEKDQQVKQCQARAA